ncbi:hypothetical protein A5682_20820 [Mycobacterium mantenii]|uniref:hypothetical protein n=1 Tax=Mycobacterium mantenii TaxID=560555 RepID=UPI0007FBEB05|nr:hypothetical protein [Mycobacterium mantenii]OBH53856.1 hypothetical protein A5687_06125 [Mycobacterium mantenii]OBH78258.1 hypothetical protein A5682_20820 [Mycobacterium mantenii]
MKFTLNILEKRGDDTDAEHRWPKYVFGGRMRTSTLVLLIAFFAAWWVYDTYRPEPPAKPPAQQIVPPGFVPDPNYTWVPRSRVQAPPTVTYTPTPTSTPPPPPPPPPPPVTTTTTTTPPFQLPQLPCILPQPFCPPSSSPATPPSQQPQPGPGPTPTSSPPAS